MPKKEGAEPTVGAPETKPGRKPREAKPTTLAISPDSEAALKAAAQATGHTYPEALQLAEQLIADLLVPEVRTRLAEKRKAAIEEMLAPAPVEREEGLLAVTRGDI
jgi:hypothetical protein